jgi:DNA modification methylase
MKDNKLEIVYKNVDDLIPYARNSRTHSEAQVNQIASSIKEFGMNAPIAIDADGGIIAGHGRVLACQKLGIKTVPTVCLSHLSETEKKAYIIADNKLALNAGWDLDLLKVELQDLETDNFDLSLTGFDEEELKDLLGEETTEDIEEGEVGEPPENPKSQKGDIWILGEHRLMCGDSTSESDVKALMQDDLADMIFTDPPYNVAVGDKNKVLNQFQPSNRITENIANDKFKTDDEISEKLWLPAFTNLYSFSKDDCAIYVTMPQGGTHMMMMMMMMHKACWNVKHELIWVKNSPTFSMGRLDYDYQHEPILYGWKKSHNFYGKGKYNKSIWTIDKPKKCDLHPTMKPIELIENALLNSSVKNNVVLDLFGGSGSTLIACEQLERKARLMELDEHYIDVIIQRWQKLTNKEAVRVDGVKFNDLQA